MKTLAAALALAAMAAIPAHAALVVSTAPTSNVTCVSGICSATAADAVLNDKDFRHLISAADLKLVSGSLAQDIVIDAKVQWAKSHMLTLDSYRSIAFQLDATSQGAGGVTMLTNDGGTGGVVTFTDKGKLSFWDNSSTLIIDKHSYRLVSDIATLAAQIARKPKDHYALAKAYDASVDGTYASAPIPTAFNGVFDGLGHAIGNLSMSYDVEHTGLSSFALFAAIGAQGRVRDLALTNANIAYVSAHTKGNFTAALAASNAGGIINVSVVNAQVLGQCAGGIVGSNTGTVTGSSVTGGEIGAKDEQNAGGLVCSNAGTITRSSANTLVSTGLGSGAGGIAADNNGGTITLSHASGSVEVADATKGTQPNAYAGGIAAINQGAIAQTYSDALVRGARCWLHDIGDNSTFGGGLVAENGGTVADSYSTGAVWVGARGECYPYIGGLVAYASSGSLQRVYSTGDTTCDYCGVCDECNEVYWGGFIGYDGALSDQSAYWDEDTGGTEYGSGYPDNDPGLTGLRDAQLKAALPDGFDPAVWGQSASINNGYPYLIANPPQ